MKINVIITHYNDSRIFNCLTSLFNQKRKPEHILIADGGSPKELIETIEEFILKNKNTELKILKGNIAETRYKVIEIYRDLYDVMVFIDTDEVAPEDWLEKIVTPIEKGECDFVGGLTIPYNKVISEAEEFINKRDKLYYNDICSEDVSQIAMGNSAWKSEIFKEIGNFDTFTIKYGISEDYDINIRAIKAGFKGKFIKEVWLYHNQSHLNSFKKLFKALYLREVRTTIAYLKHNYTFNQSISATRKKKIFHPFQAVLLISKPIAFLEGWIEYNKGVKCEYYKKN